MKLQLFRRKEPEPEEPRCTGCCNNCRAEAPRCETGRKHFGIPEPENEKKTEE